MNKKLNVKNLKQREIMPGFHGRFVNGENIPIEYLQDCHYYHEIWLSDPKYMEEGNVLVIGSNLIFFQPETKS